MAGGLTYTVTFQALHARSVLGAVAPEILPEA